MLVTINFFAWLEFWLKSSFRWKSKFSKSVLVFVSLLHFWFENLENIDFFIFCQICLSSKQIKANCQFKVNWQMSRLSHVVSSCTNQTESTWVVHDNYLLTLTFSEFHTLVVFCFLVKIKEKSEPVACCVLIFDLLL